MSKAKKGRKNAPAAEPVDESVVEDAPAPELVEVASKPVEDASEERPVEDASEQPVEDASEQPVEDASEQRFVEDSLIRGDAAKRDKEGNLPRDATHEIVEEHEGELPKIRRRRFKTF